MKSALILLLFFVTVSVYAQDSTHTESKISPIKMITNRPGFTEASRAVFKKGFQIETGFQYSKSPFSKGSSEYSANILFPNLGLIYGVSENVEVRVFGNYEGNRVSYGASPSTYSYGLEGLTLGTKINLTKRNGFLPEMALLINQGVPTSASTASFTPIWSTQALLAWSYSLPYKFSLSGNLSYAVRYEFDEISTLAHPNSLGYTINVGYTITPQLGTYMELYGQNALGAGKVFDMNAAGGFKYRINPKFQVDLIGGYGFETGSTLVNAGFSWLIIKE
tara:strand:+ start:44459 stop:45292 length:834 start_codon:yes stop_codon:yes gene_type:complete